MIIKPFQEKIDQIDALERLLPLAEASQRSKIEKELRFVRSGFKSEKEAAYYIDFTYGESASNHVVLHDLRLESGARVAQIDHLIINRFLEIYVCESKAFHAGIKVTEHGEFMQWNTFTSRYEGIRSPLEQNERHISVLKEVLRGLSALPVRLGAKLMPECKSVILVSPNARIERPPTKAFNTENILRSDQLKTYLNKQVDDTGFFSTLSSMSRIVSSETIRSIGEELAALHAPVSYDYAARFGMVIPPFLTVLRSSNAMQLWPAAVLG